MKEAKENKFTTPTGYFDNFNARLMDKIVKEESLIPKNDGFGVPDNYFTSLNAQLSKKLNTEEPKVISLKLYKKFYYAAASIAAMLLLGFWLNQKNETKLNFEDLATTELDAYFEDNNLDISSYEIADYVSLENINLTDITEKNIEDNTILEYLDDNVDELDDLNIMYDEFK